LLGNRRSFRIAAVVDVMTCGDLRAIEQGVRQWMETHEYESVQQVQGSMSQKNCPDPSAFERAQYMRAIKGIQYVMTATW
jgi:hypothetical protein